MGTNIHSQSVCLIHSHTLRVTCRFSHLSFALFDCVCVRGIPLPIKTPKYCIVCTTATAVSVAAAANFRVCFMFVCGLFMHHITIN